CALFWVPSCQHYTHLPAHRKLPSTQRAAGFCDKMDLSLISTTRNASAAHALLAPIENSLAGSVLRVYDLLLESALLMVAEVILPIEHHLIAIPGTKL